MFKLTKVDGAVLNVPDAAYFPVKANEAVVCGEALVLTAGALTKCSATTTPEYISLGQVEAAATDRVIAVYRVSPAQEFEVPVSAAPTSLKAGDKVTLYTDGLQVTATTTDGVAKVVSVNGATAAGHTIVVRF